MPAESHLLFVKPDTIKIRVRREMPIVKPFETVLFLLRVLCGREVQRQLFTQRQASNWLKSYKEKCCGTTWLYKSFHGPMDHVLHKIFKSDSYQVTRPPPPPGKWFSNVNLSQQELTKTASHQPHNSGVRWLGTLGDSSCNQSCGHSSFVTHFTAGTC